MCEKYRILCEKFIKLWILNITQKNKNVKFSGTFFLLETNIEKNMLKSDFRYLASEWKKNLDSPQKKWMN